MTMTTRTVTDSYDIRCSYNCRCRDTYVCLTDKTLRDITLPPFCLSRIVDDELMPKCALHVGPYLCLEEYVADDEMNKTKLFHIL